MAQTEESVSSGSSSSVSEGSTTTIPYQQRYYDQLLGQANNLYQTGLPGYYPGQTVAGLTPAQLESMNLTSNFITGQGQQMMSDVNRNYFDMLSGQVQTGAGTPWEGMRQAYYDDSMRGAQDMMSQLRTTQVAYQPGGSSRADLMNSRVMEAANRDYMNNLAKMYGTAYSDAQRNRQYALGEYTNIMNMPQELAKNLYNRVGLPQQELNQATMNDMKARYDYEAMKPWLGLQYYQNFISGNYGGTNQSSSSTFGENEGTATTTLL